MPSVFGRRSSSAANTAAAAASAAAAAASGSSTPQPPPPLPSAYVNQATPSTVRGANDAVRNGKGTVASSVDGELSYSGSIWTKASRGEQSVRSVSSGGQPGAVGEPNGVRQPSQSRFFSSSIPKAATVNGQPFDSSTDSILGRENSTSNQNSPSTMNSAAFSTVGPHASLAPSAFSSYDQRSTHSAVPSSSTAHASIASSSTTESVLRETLARRSRSLAYVRCCLSAAGHPAQASMPQQYPSSAQSWLDTVRITRRSLEAYYNSDSMRKRASRYYVAGCSLSSAMDMTVCDEFARSVLAVLNEAESFGDANEKDKTKVKNFFKSSIRGAGTSASHAKRMAGLSEFSNTYDGVSVGGPPMSTLTLSGVELIGTHVPFALDALQTTITFLDMLQEVYCKLLLLSSSAGGNVARDVDGLPLNSASSTMHDLGGGGGGGNTALNVSTIDIINKLDAKVKKMLAHIFKELDALARHLARQELASVDPQMARELGSPSLPDGVSGGLGEPNQDERSKTPLGTGSVRQHTLRNNPFTSSAPNLLIAASNPSA